MTPRDAALHVAVQEAFSKLAADEYRRVRAEAQAVFRQARRDGQPQAEVLLPDGTRIGRISILDGGTVDHVDEDALREWAAERNPDAFEDYADPAVLADADVLALIRDKFPDLVRPRMRPATRDAYLKEAAAAGGWLRDESTGEQVHVLDSAPAEATGEFTFSDRASAARRAAIMGALRAGDPVVQRLAFGALLALPAAQGAPGE